MTSLVQLTWCFRHWVFSVIFLCSEIWAQLVVLTTHFLKDSVKKKECLFVFITNYTYYEFIQRLSVLLQDSHMWLLKLRKILQKFVSPRLKHYLEFGRTKHYRSRFSQSFQRLLICTARILIRRLDCLTSLTDTVPENQGILREFSVSHKFINTFMGLLVKMQKLKMQCVINLCILKGETILVPKSSETSLTRQKRFVFAD